MAKTDWQFEAKHLQDVYQELVEMSGLLETLLVETKATGVETLTQINGDISLNFDSVLDNLDTFSMIEIKNKEMDQLKVKWQQAEGELEKIKRLLIAPYFGKVDVRFPEEEVESFYFGINGFVNQQGDNRIYDWRSPISELFYNNQMGDSSYIANNRQIDASIEKRRQLLVRSNQLLNFFDATVAIQDDVLLSALTSDDSSYMQDITATIQQEQNQIIRDTDSQTILVNGIAGSGKTSTIMQRIAFLLYRFRQSLTTDNVLILSPNSYFVAYISRVLPSLGERNPLNLTLRQFLTKVDSQLSLETEEAYFSRINQVMISSQTEILRSAAFCHEIAEKSQKFELDESYFKAITKGKELILSSEALFNLYQQTPVTLSVRERIQGTKEVVLSQWELTMEQQSQSQQTRDQLLALTESQQERYFGKLLEDDDRHLQQYGKKLVQRTYQSVTQAINNIDWFDEWVLLKVFYRQYSGEVYHQEASLTVDEATVLLIIRHICLEKKEIRDLRVVLVDEIQDYTPAQIILLQLLLPKASFTLVGDENQAIFNSSIEFNQIHALFNQQDRQVRRYDLVNSYRSSAAITGLFAPLAKDSQHLKIVPVRSEGCLPVYFTYENLAEFVNQLQIILQNLRNPLTILTKTTKEALELRRFLFGKTAMSQENLEIQAVTVAKGLEYSHVLLYDVSQENYRSQRDQKILYTAISRAMESIYLSAHGSFSTFLNR